MELVTNGSLLIKLSDLTYPVYLNNIRQQNPNVSLAKEPNLENIEALGYTIVERVPQPSGDVVTEGTPILVDGKYRQNWEVRSFTTEELESQLSSKKQTLFSQISRLKNSTLEKGFLYTFPDNSQYHIQLRDGDRANITALRVKADQLVSLGVTDPVILFRTYENVTVPITPATMVDLSDSAFMGYNAILTQLWTLKNAVTSATTIAELPDIPETL